MPQKLPIPLANYLRVPRLGTYFQEIRQRSGDAPNRWGDPPPGKKPLLSPLAIVAVVIAALALVAGPLPLVAAALTGEVAWVGPLWALGCLASLLLFPVGMVLAYVALFHCRLDRAIAGRSLAWLALAFSFLSLAVWHAALTGLGSRVSVWIFLGILGVAGIHALVYAAESAAGKYLLLSLILGGALFSLLILWMLNSREGARRQQATDNLRKIGMELHQQWDTQHHRPEPRDWKKDR